MESSIYRRPTPQTISDFVKLSMEKYLWDSNGTTCEYDLIHFHFKWSLDGRCHAGIQFKISIKSKNNKKLI